MAVGDLIKEAVSEARELCGCTQCQGGYEIGARTLGLHRGPQRPSSCVAAVILERMLRVRATS